MEPLLKETMQYYAVAKPAEYTERCLWWAELIENIQNDTVKGMLANIFMDALPK